MGISILYAYLDNIQILSMALALFMGVFLIMLLFVRFNNDVDKDDWYLLMQYTVPLFIFFLFLTMLPGLEHVKEVNQKFTEVLTKPTEIKNETSLYPSSVCNSVRMCQ